MTDILGPANAVNAVTVRPAETRSFLSLDSWFKDCTTPLADDGTDVTAAWLNGMVAALRSVWRGNGMLLDGITPIVPEIGTDDTGVLKSIQQLIQRGQLQYAEDTGTANNIVASLTPAIVEYKPGLKVLIKIAATNTGGACVINLNTLGNKNVKRIDGQNPGENDLPVGALIEFGYDGTNFQIMNVWSLRSILTANKDYYVNDATGSDTLNNGLTVGTPFKTITKALSVMSSLDNNGFSVSIHVADGTYASNNRLPRINGSGIVNLIGNLTTPASCLITGAGSGFFADSSVGTYDISGFKFACNGDGVFADGSGNTLYLGRCDWGACFGEGHIVAQRGSSIIIKGTVQDAGAFMRISGNCARHLISVSGATIDIYPCPLTITTTVTFASEFVRTYRCGTLSFPTGVGYSPITNPGFVTGKRYTSVTNAVIDTFGGGPNVFPGTVAGTTDGFGIYV